MGIWSGFPLASWIIPPVVGALIGFATNVIAIKMLFRPLRELRVFGIRLPFTPGILPRERHKLALSIGAMTEKHLFTGELIRERLDDREFRGRALSQVSLASGRFFSLPLETIAWFKPGAETPSDAARFFVRIIKTALDSPLLDDAACSLGSALLSKSRGKTLRAVLGEEKSALLAQKLAGLAGLKGGAFSTALAALIERRYPFMARSLIQVLRSKDVHAELEIQGRIFLSGAVLKLSTLQRFFISAAQYDRTLSEKMGEIVDDFIDQLEISLEDAKIRERVIGFLLESAGAFLEKSDEGRSFLESSLSAFLDKPVDEILSFALPLFKTSLSTAPLFAAPREETSAEAGRLLASFLRSTGGDETGMRWALDAFLQKHREDSLASLLGLGEDKKAEFDQSLTTVLLREAKERAGTILASLDIKTIVAAKIDSLDMLEVEAMVLGIMADKLKWIDFFGAILGALIGLSQVLLGNFFH